MFCVPSLNQDDSKQEGLGILFSAYFNNDLKKENIWKYIPIKPERWKEYMKKENEYIEIFKNRAREKLNKNEIQEFYGPERGIWYGFSCCILSNEKGLFYMRS